MKALTATASLLFVAGLILALVIAINSAELTPVVLFSISLFGLAALAAAFSRRIFDRSNALAATFLAIGAGIITIFVVLALSYSAVACFGICGPQPPMLAAVDCQSPSSTSVTCTATVANTGYEAVPVVADACTIQFGNSNLTAGENNGTMIGTPGILGGDAAIAAKSSQSITCTVQTNAPAEGTQFLLSVLFSDGYSVGIYGNWPTS